MLVHISIISLEKTPQINDQHAATDYSQWALDPEAGLRVCYPTKAFKSDSRQSSCLTLPTSDAYYVHVYSTFLTVCRWVLSDLIVLIHLTKVQRKFCRLRGDDSVDVYFTSSFKDKSFILSLNCYEFTSRRLNLFGTRP